MPLANNDGLLDRWTQTGWATVNVRQHLDLILSCDFIPSCLLCDDLFLQDYASGEDQYCSPALVNALLCLAIRQQNQHTNNDRGGNGRPLWQETISTSEELFHAAWSLLEKKKKLSSLPDAQALGVLAMYHLTCGRESEARELAECFADEMTNLCLREPHAITKGNQYRVARATSYCAAISLTRLLGLINLPPLHSQMRHIRREDTVVLDLPTCNLGPALAVSHDAHRPEQLRSGQITRIKIFQLTEWVYKFLASATFPSASCTTVKGDEVMALYRDCLVWYDDFLTLAEAHGDSSASVLFAHMYYQFCILRVFWPFIDIAFEDYNINTNHICLEAARSIVGLTTTYTGVNELGHWPLLVPYFLRAADVLRTGVWQDPSRGHDSFSTSGMGT